MIWVAVLLTGADTGSGVVMVESPDSELWRATLDPITTQTVTELVARCANTTPNLVKLREQPKRRRNRMSMFEFAVFDNSPAPF